MVLYSYALCRYGPIQLWPYIGTAYKAVAYTGTAQYRCGVERYCSYSYVPTVYINMSYILQPM